MVFEIHRTVPHVHVAIEHLLKSWDAIHEVEKIVGFEITTDELSDLAGGLDSSREVRTRVTPSQISEWLESIQGSTK
jgi:hypothetical protein